MDYLDCLWIYISSIGSKILDFIPSLKSEFWSGIIGSIFGAAVTGIISYALQNKAFNQRRSVEIEEKNDEYRVIGYSILMKMIRIHTGYRNFYAYLKDAEAKRSNDISMEWWSIVLPIANIGEKEEFSYPELALIASIGDSALTNRIMQIDRLYNSTSEAFRVYSDVRRRLSDELPANNFSGSVGTGFLDRETYLRLRPKMLDANSLIDSIRENVFKDTPDAEDILILTHKTLVSKGILPKTSKIELKENIAPLTS